MQRGNSRLSARRIPLEIRYRSVDEPVPVHMVRPAVKVASLPFGMDPPPWLHTGEPSKPFHFCQRMRLLCTDIVQKSEPLQHIDVSQILFGFTQARNNHSHGLQARVTPLRFKDGQLTRRHRGTNYQVQRFFVDGREMLYLMTFCLPRFLNRSFEDKFVTVFHELFHISAEFNGDLRRHEGRYSVHTASQKKYDQEMAELAKEYLRNGADAKVYDFLRLNCLQLLTRHGQIIGHKLPRPKLIPIG